jgi:hypothetical protein
VVAVSAAEANFLKFIFNLIYRLIIGIDLFDPLWIILAVDLSVHQITFLFFLFSGPFPALHSVRSSGRLVRESDDRSNRREWRKRGWYLLKEKTRFWRG